MQYLVLAKNQPKNSAPAPAIAPAPAVPAHPPEGYQFLEAKGLIGGQAISLQILVPKAEWWSLSTLAPTFPGLTVAVLGLWVAHRFARARERRKEIADLCVDLTVAIDDAAETAIAAWLEADKSVRVLKVFETKRKLQVAGAAATSLRRRSVYWSAYGLGALSNNRSSIDMVTQVADLRREATKDPFEDPERPANQLRANDVVAVAALARAAVDQGYSDLFNHR